MHRPCAALCRRWASPAALLGQGRVGVAVAACDPTQQPPCCCCVVQVSKHTFLAALKERGAVLFCPGGQAEMVHAWRAFLPGESRELVLHTRHKGFCR